jgi:hypothetical protein
MLDFIKSLNLTEELKNNEIYDLLKTDSSETNLQILSSLEKYNSNEELINDYTGQNLAAILNIFNNLSSTVTKLCNDEEKNESISDIEKYISGFSRIIFLFSLIQKNNELLSNLLMETKKYLKKFYIDCNIQKAMKEKITSCANDLMCSSIVTSKRNYSRRSTKEDTITSVNKFTGINLQKFKQQENMIINPSEEEFTFTIHTPKFEEEENNEIIEEIEEPKNNSSGSSGKDNLNFEVIKEAINKRESNKKFDSSLTLSKMDFVLEPELEPEPKLEKTKSHNIGNDCKLNNFQKRRSKIKKKDIVPKNPKQILANFFDAIKILYKKGKINSDIKILIKQIIISDSKKIIKQFLDSYDINNNDYDRKLLSEKIQMFLLDNFSNLK